MVTKERNTNFWTIRLFIWQKPCNCKQFKMIVYTPQNTMICTIPSQCKPHAIYYMLSIINCSQQFSNDWSEYRHVLLCFSKSDDSYTMINGQVYTSSKRFAFSLRKYVFLWPSNELTHTQKTYKSRQTKSQGRGSVNSINGIIDRLFFADSIQSTCRKFLIFGEYCLFTSIIASVTKVIF